MTTAPRDLLQAVAEVARLAGEAARRHFRSGLEVRTKEDGSPVTRADVEAEEVARAWIHRHFPRDGVVGEELGASGGPGARRWFLDPVDGTRSFLCGVPLWGSMVGVMEGGTVLAGAIALPALGESICAARGEGCWWNGARCHVSLEDAVSAAVALTTDERFHGDAARKASWEGLAGRVRLARSWGDCYGYLLVATGRAELMTDGQLQPWDAVPLVPILEEAGGTLTDWSRGPVGFGDGAIATNRSLAGPLRDILLGPSWEARS